MYIEVNKFSIILPYFEHSSAQTVPMIQEDP